MATGFLRKKEQAIHKNKTGLKIGASRCRTKMGAKAQPNIERRSKYSKYLESKILQYKKTTKSNNISTNESFQRAPDQLIQSTQITS
ncbi:hypothetical protein KY289_030095 [Solanum tuberosum]|nr:hypothetical protein KY289_030095 [Solanum tuberosum]